LSPYNDARHFPTDKASFERQFTESSELVGNKAQRITVCHAVKSSMTLWNMKWRCDILMPYLMQNHITILVDKFDQATVSSIGYFICVNPHYVHRESFQENIYQVIERNINFEDDVFKSFVAQDDDGDEELYDVLNIPSFELGIAPVKCGNGSFQAATEAIDVIGTKEKAAYLKEIFSSIDFAKHLHGCKFIPRGLIQMTSVDTFKQFINMQNSYLNSVDCVPIFGLSMEAARHPMVVETNNGDVNSTIIGALELFPGIDVVYQTNMTSVSGKWLVIFQKAHETQVKKFLDDELYQLFGCLPDGLPNRTIGDYEYPRRPGLQRRNGHTLSYAHMLQQEVAEFTSSVVHSRPKRAPAAIVYHEAETGFPPLKKTNLGASSQGRASATSTVTTESLQLNEITELIDSKINTKVNEVIYQTDMKIKAAVDPINIKIDRFDANMNANFKHLSDQMAALFGGMTVQHHPNPQQFFHSSLAASTMTQSHGSAPSSQNE
jgi:hypothetical protein